MSEQSVGMKPADVQKFLGVSQATFYRLLKNDQTFPRGRQVIRERLWDRAEIEQWWAERPRS